MKNVTLAIVLAAAVGGLAQAQDNPPPRPARAPPPPGPSLELAIEAAQTAVATCAANGYTVGVSVLDSSGEVKVQLVADGISGRAAAAAQRKANAALKYEVNSAVTQQRVADDPAFAAEVAADPTLFARAGAQLIMRDGEIIGAMGVGGAPGGERDDVCTSAGLERIQDRL